jgi:hypothetical protein
MGDRRAAGALDEDRPLQIDVGARRVNSADPQIVKDDSYQSPREPVSDG